MSHHSDETLSHESSLAKERLASEFREAWQRGEAPDIEEYLSRDDTHTDRLVLLSALVRADLECRLHRDASVRVELYLDRFPELAADTTLLLDLITVEYTTRRSCGIDTTPVEYEQRFPRLGKQLSSRLKDVSQHERERTDALTCPFCNGIVEGPVGDQSEVSCPHCGSLFSPGGIDPTESFASDSLPALGKFQLLEQVGRGGLGTVYRARDTVLGRTVAIKVPRSERFTSAEAVERFEREARAAASLEHPGIVRVLEFCRGERFPYIVSEYVQGITLSDALTGRRFSFRETACIIARVAEALDHAHQRAVVHRDVKPSNVILTEAAAPEEHRPDSTGDAPSYSQPRLTDFGLARRDEDDVAVTVEGQVLGTYAYLSPEQARGESHRADRRTDIYSLGVTLYEMLAHERPFRGNRKMLLHQVLHEEPRSPRKLNDQIPRDLETITLRCMAKDVDRRYATAGELAADLRRWLAGEPIRARPVRTPERLWLWCRRHRAVSLLSLALGLALIGGFAGVLWQWLNAERHQREATRYFKEARRDVDTFLVAVSDSLQYYPGAQEARKRLLRQAAEKYQRFAAERSDDPELRAEFGRASMRLGDVRLLLNEYERAERDYRSALSTFDSLADGHPGVLEYRFERATCETKLGIVLHEMGRSGQAEQRYESARTELSDLVAAAPQTLEYRDGLGACLVDLGLLMHALGREEEAERAIGDAVRELSTVVNSNGGARGADPNQRRYRFALATARNVLGALLTSRGRHDEAIAAFRESAEDFRRLGTADWRHPNYIQGRADALLNLANAMRTLGREEESSQAYLGAIEAYRQLVKVIPDVPVYREDLIRALTNCGQLLHEIDRNPKARELLTEANTMLGALIEEYPLVGKYYRQSVLTQASLAQAERDLGQLEPAETLLREAIDTCDFLARGDPDVQYRELQGVLAGNLGRTLSCADRDDEGETELTKAIDRLQTLAQSDPASSHYRDELAWSYMYRGDLFRSRGQTELAAADYRQVRMLRVQLADNPLDVQNQYRLAWFLANCPDPGHREPEEAVRWAQQAVKQVPDSATYRNALGAAYLRCGKLDEAVEHLEKAAELRSGEHCRDGFLLAIAYCKREDGEKAREVFDRAADWMDEHCPGNEQWTRIRREVEECLGQRAVEAEAP